jgi:mannose/cellobiose epimerase-like protein (N-acyl-D-glucosamine 2-epimerase family)
MFGQYQVKCQYLINPGKAISYVDSCAKFWLTSYDSSLGGFYTNVSRNGSVNTSAGTQKDMMTQSRNAYGMTRAFMMTGNEKYLQKASQALTFMYQHAWDKTNDGWYWELDKNGNPTSGSTNKTAFYQHYALLGIIAYYETTRDTAHWSWLMKGYQSNEKHLWDSRAQYFGYYDTAANNWSNIRAKSFNGTVDAITTHLLHLYLLTGSDTYKTRLFQIVDNMLNHLVASMSSQKIGFCEGYDSNWNFDATNTMTIMGHILKTSWCFARAYQITPDTNYLSASKKLFAHVMQRGYDSQFGGPYKDFDRTTGSMLMWGISDTAKAWWQMEQAVTAGLSLYEITRDDSYLKVADETLDFYMNYFVDHTYGEVYENRARNGAYITSWGDNKGGSGKAGYHSIELGYYTYLYGSLFYKNQPASLYYYFSPAASGRNIALSPLTSGTLSYKIQSVTLNDTAYNTFTAADRILSIPSGIGGKFKVTFAPNVSGVAETTPAKATEFTLYQNYPNPFNPSTTIRFRIPQQSQVSLKVYDILGNEVADLIHEELSAGSYEKRFFANDLASGVYVYRLTAGNLQQSKKLVVVK